MERVKKVNAFTLFEVSIAMLIIGILMLAAVPNFMPLIARAKAQEARIQLRYIHNLEEQHRYMYSRYTADMARILFEPPRTVEDGGTSNYRYEIVDASATGFRARAVAVVDFDGDGTFNVWEIDQDGRSRETVPD